VCSMGGCGWVGLGAVGCGGAAPAPADDGRGRKVGAGVEGGCAAARAMPRSSAALPLGAALRGAAALQK
jgi:hypothetical protein